MQQAMQVLTSQATQEWYTPPHIIDRARHCLGTIDLDPCTSELAQTWIKAERYHTLVKRATLPWHGTVWLNPPFDDAAAWVTNLINRYQCGAVPSALMLVNSALGYKWYEELWRYAPVVCLRDRLAFINDQGISAGMAKKGQTIVYLGSDNRRFIDTFGDLGRILLP